MALPLKKLSYWILAGITAATLAGFYFMGSLNRPPPATGMMAAHDNRPPAVPVMTTRVERADIPVYLNGLGTVTPLHTVTVRPRVDGELLRVAFSEGQLVKKGDLLAEIDPRPYAAQLIQNEGQLARDQALLENARVDWQRYRELLGKDSIAAQQVASQRALVSQYEATVKIDQGQIDATRLQLDYCRITAPISGRVGLRKIDPGNIVRAGDPDGLIVITGTTPISVLFTLPEDRLPPLLTAVKRRAALTVEARDRTATRILAQGHLLALDNQIDPATGTLRLKALFPNSDESLFANQFVNVRLNLDPLRNTPVLPTTALLSGSAGDFVYVVDGESKARMQVIHAGPRDGERVAVLQGLDEGTEVVLEGMDRLRDGVAVQVIRQQEAGGHGNRP